MGATQGKSQIASDKPRQALEDWKNSNPSKKVTDYHIQSGGVDIWWEQAAE